MQPLRQFVRRGMLPALLSLAAFAVTAQDKAQEKAQDTLRPAVATPALAAQQLLSAGKHREALAKVVEAEAVPDRTPYENFVLDQLRGGAAAGAGDNEVAMRSFAAAVNSGRMKPEEALPIIEGLAGTSFRMKDYAGAVEWSRRYFKDGGSRPQVRRVLAQALLQRGESAPAIAELKTLVADEERTSGKPAEDLLRLLGATQVRSGDTAGYAQTLEALLRHHPKPAYWRDRIARVQNQPQFDDALAIDVYRLLLAVGALEEAAEFVSLAEFALRAGLPGEARRVVEAGYAAGKLGTGDAAAQHQGLRERAARLAEQDAAQLPAAPAPAAGADGNALVTLGLAYASAGRAEAAIALVEQGIAKGGLKQPELARLRLGWLLATSAGRRAQAVPVFDALKGGAAGLGDLARLWALHAAR